MAATPFGKGHETVFLDHRALNRAPRTCGCALASLSKKSFLPTRSTTSAVSFGKCSTVVRLFPKLARSREGEPGVRNHPCGPDETIDMEGIIILGRTESTRKRPIQEVNVLNWARGATEKGWTFVAYLLSIGCATSTGLMIGIALSLSTTESVALASSASALTCGLLFSILELRKSPEPAKRVKPLTCAPCSTQRDLNVGLAGRDQIRSSQRLAVANESDGISRVVRRHVPTA